jgi:hypothetical protein
MGDRVHSRSSSDHTDLFKFIVWTALETNRGGHGGMVEVTFVWELWDWALDRQFATRLQSMDIFRGETVLVSLNKEGQLPRGI